jgi:4-hydroxybenzoate polyprenyltransferase
MLRLYAQTGFFSNVLLAISIVWGSIYSGFIVGDILSIVIIIIILIFSFLYLVYTVIKKNR